MQRVESIVNDHSKFGRYKTETGFYNDGGRMRRTYSCHEKKVEIRLEIFGIADERLHKKLFQRIRYSVLVRLMCVAISFCSNCSDD